MESKIVALIPVRGGSKSIPLKNIKNINNRPLVYWVIDAAINCTYIDKIYISTDSYLIKDKINEYREINKNNQNIYKLECIDRGENTATDTASTESVMLEFAQKHKFNIIVLIQATSPFTTTKDLTEALELFNMGDYDSLLSVVRQKRFFWEQKNGLSYPLNYDPAHRPRRQDFPGVFVENGAIYITTKKALLNSGCRLSGKIGLYEMDENSYYEIDEPSDWPIVEILLKKNKTDMNIKKIISQIKMVLTDCDGVLTDGGMYYSENGDEFKKFNTKDGMAVELLRKKGIITGIITGEDRSLVKRRTEKIGVDELYMGIKNKLEIVRSLCKKYNLNLKEVAYLGDDINDLQVIKKVGLGCSVADGMECVKEVADYVTKTKGGEGALREVAELILEGISLSNG